MLEFSKKFLFYSLIIISSITFINISVLYWFPILIPLSSYLPVGLMMVSYFLKIYYLIPISFLICFLMFFTAFSFRKEKKVLPIILLIYSVCDLSVLSFSFFDSWLNDDFFIAGQAIQFVITAAVVIFMCIYFALLKKSGKAMVNKERDAKNA